MIQAIMTNGEEYGKARDIDMQDFRRANAERPYGGFPVICKACKGEMLIDPMEGFDCM
jgi:hypothetical protein